MAFCLLDLLTPWKMTSINTFQSLAKRYEKFHFTNYDEHD
jgi:hypothetical protein